MKQIIPEGKNRIIHTNKITKGDYFAYQLSIFKNNSFSDTMIINFLTKQD